jgi:hypothetical protein
MSDKQPTPMFEDLETSGFHDRIMARMAEERANPTKPAGPPPRPARSQEQYQHYTDVALATVQAEWDQARSVEKAQAEWKAKKAAEKAELEKAREAERQRIAAEQERQMLEPARLAYLRNGGSAEGWEREKGEIAAEIRKREAIAAGVNSPVRSLVHPSAA